MSTPNDKILFFDKEGYPYNLTFNDDTNEWGGKIYFDENSSDTFKTICLYIFENVSAFNFTDVFDLRSSQLFNWSGMTFVPQTFTNEIITDIQRVNSSSNFYSKWIYGDKFDIKFPVGTSVCFHNISGSTDLHLNNFHGSGVTFYNVLGNKKDAFLITTYTDNKNFDFDFYSGTVSSVNLVKAPDFGNEYLVDFNNLNYYRNKKISVSGSENNDGVYTFDDYNILKTKIYDFQLPNITYNTASTLTLDFLLMTQRPELYEGNININYIDSSISGTTIEFYNYINTNIDFVNTGQTIIFETPDGGPIHSSDPEFTITGFINKDYITTQSLTFYKDQELNIILTTSAITYTGLTYNDYIELIATPYVTGGTYHDKRQFQVLNISGNQIQVKEYVIPETGYTYTINKVINKKKIKKLYCQQNTVPTPDTFSGYTVCYSTSNRITLTQSILPSGDTTYFYENTISAMRNKYRTLLDRYGLNLYHYNYNGNNYLIFEGLDYNYQPYYSGATAFVDSTELTVSNNFTYLTTGSTVQDSDVYYFSTMEPFQGYEKIYHYEDSKLAKKFLVEIYFNLERDSIDYGFNVNLNYVDYYIPLSGSSTTYTLDTINSFIDKYSYVLDKNGINVYSGYTTSGYTGYTLIFESQLPNIVLNNIEVRVNYYSTYEIIRRINNNSIVIDSSELYLVTSGKSLYDYELSTGMIIDISGATHIINNKQYNILRITSDIIQLSYQGPFLYEYASNLTLSVNNFLRTPRGSYDRDVYYRFSWDPIEENDPQITPNIFYYDYSGTQLEDNGDLTYLGEKPLWNSTNENLVFLNDEPNNNIDRIYDPQYQQTVFETLTHTLERLNSSINYDYVPVPMQIFIGFNSKLEGVCQNELKIEKLENIIFTGKTSTVSGSTVSINNFLITSGNTYSYINYYDSGNTYFSFNSYGFEPKQHISLSFLEDTITGHTIFGNYGIYEIEDVTEKTIKVIGTLEDFDTSLSAKTYNFTIQTEPDIVATISLYGQTEVEDDRFVQHLKLLGAKLEPDAQPIFKESDINESGIDFTILNRKRKELLSIYPEIYNYIGSYKALINVISFFGYNDLELYEYYKCIKPNSPLYNKLQRVLIKDIFINTIPGWSEIELDSKNYLKTNLFNLTYQITDFDGNYVEMYSLNEVQQKLTKLVYWLRRNIIPLSANILDITGVANAGTTMYLNYNGANYAKKITINQENSAINFDYIQTLNIDTNYLFTINFYITSGATMPDYWTAKIKTFHLNTTTMELEPVQYIDLFKKDLLSYSFNVDKEIDPYMYIETQSYNDYGFGYTNYKLFNYNEGRNFILINNNFSEVNYKYVNDDYGYYIIDDGRFYIIKF